MDENLSAEQLAIELFSELHAESWMTKPKWFLDGLTPRQVLESKGGEERVKEILVRIAMGDYS